MRSFSKTRSSRPPVGGSWGRSGLRRFILQPWFRLSRGLTLGVRGLVRDEDGRVALVRHSCGPGWLLPGGGVERGETLEEALARELAEESGIEITARPRLFAVYSNDAAFAGDHVALFVVDGFHAHGWRRSLEIAEAGFFARDGLPEATTAGTRRRIDEVFGGRQPAARW